MSQQPPRIWGLEFPLFYSCASWVEGDLERAHAVKEVHTHTNINSFSSVQAARLYVPASLTVTQGHVTEDQAWEVGRHGGGPAQLLPLFIHLQESWMPLSHQLKVPGSFSAGMEDPFCHMPLWPKSIPYLKPLTFWAVCASSTCNLLWLMVSGDWWNEILLYIVFTSLHQPTSLFKKLRALLFWCHK